MFRRILPVAFVLGFASAASADENAYLQFVRAKAAEMRGNDRPPADRAAWEKQKAELRRKLTEAWGGFPDAPAPLAPADHGELKRDGYRVRKVTFQTLPGVRTTANLYLPDGDGKRPAVLCVHGHWKGAKQDPVVQSRCIGLAKLGFVVLVVDAFGAGERGVGTKLGEYHGEMTAATLLPVGKPLSGLQVYENMRAVDYLQSLPNVDGSKIGVTGASGGGNQSMYVGAMDERIKAVVPVCSVGNYQAYLGAACCLCEVVPGALAFTEEWGLLAMVAPRALMVVSATKDAPQFSVGEAKKSLALAEPVFKLFDVPGSVRHAIFESGHDYSRPMREAMYGWMTKHLKGEGDGGPVPEPEIKTEDPEALRCFPGDSRPADWVTVPKFAAAEGRRLLAQRQQSKSREDWDTAARKARTAFIDQVCGGRPPDGKVEIWGGRFNRYSFRPEPDARADSLWMPGEVGPFNMRLRTGMAVVVGLNGWEEESKRWGAITRDSEFRLILLEPRATGATAVKSDKIGRAPDHNSAEWGLWLGRPLLGQWVTDVRRQLDNIQQIGWLPPTVTVIGHGPAGLVALAVAATDDRVTTAVAVGSLGSFITDRPYTNQRLGVMAPGILKHVGDVPHLAALAAPKRLVIAGPVDADGKPMSADAFAPTRDVYKLLGAADRLTVTTDTNLAGVLAALGQPDAPIFETGAKLKVESAEGTGGEGPAWDPERGLFTSGNGNINRLARDGIRSVFRAKAGTNGLLFDRDGSLLACEPDQRRVTRTARDGKVAVIAERYAGKKLNTPNDITVDSKGRIYFSDPRYGPKDDMQQRTDKGETIEGVYRIDPDGTVSRVVGREVERANGVLVSADDKYLFVADNNNDAVSGARKLWRFDLKPNGSVDPASRKLLHDWGTGRGPDGLKQDEQGRLYVAAGLNRNNPPFEPDGTVKGGVYVIDPESGKRLAFQPVPTDEVTNCAFGGDDLRTLYITGGGTLYSIRTTTAGRVVWPKK